MSESPVYPVPAAWRDSAHVNAERYRELYQRSVEQPEQFWAEQAETFLTWDKPWDKVVEADMAAGDVAWFIGGKLNVAVNCIDRHLPRRGDQTALIWEGDNPGEALRISYRELHENVSRLGNVLRQRGVKKGDRVCLYLPMIPEAVYAMLACARIGAVHS
ncbi:MAG: AMP-binding protein, partial [Bacteroidales bacterium]|nr:AMP-binding protein [Bacteroidales bacterium]